MTIDEDAGPTDVTGLLTATDPDDDSLTWSVASQPSHGSLSGFSNTQSGTTSNGVDPTGLTYQPDADYDGSDSFDVQVADGNGGTDTLTVNVDVQDAPEVTSMERATPASPTNADSVDFEVTFSESVSGVDTGDFGVSATSGDVSGSVSAVSGSGNRYTVTVSSISGDGDLRLDLEDDDSITNSDDAPLGGVGTSEAGDGSFTSGQTFAVDNTAPTFNSGSAPTFAENDGGTVLDIQADDDTGSDYDTDVTYTLVGGDDQAAFSIDTNTGELSFDSAPDFESPTDSDSDNDYAVQIQATDDVGNTATDTITVTVTDVDEAPTASDSTRSTDEDTMVAVADGAGADLLELATDPDSGDTLSVHAIDGTAFSDGNAVTLDSGASVTVDSDGSWSYDPNDQFESLASGDSTTDSYTYTVADSDGDTDQGIISITVNGVNDAPTAADDASQSTDEDTVVSVANGAGADLLDLANDPDDDDSVSFDTVAGSSFSDGSPVTLGSGATVTVDSDGSWSYDPNGQFDALAVGDSTTDSFTYTVTDGNGGTDQATVTVTVTGVNDAPGTPVDGDGAADEIVERAPNGDAVRLTIDSIDPDSGDAVTFSLADDAGGRFQIDASTGVVTVADGSLLDHESNTSHTITVEATDGSASSTAAFTVVVTDVDESPTFTSATATSIAEDAANDTAVIDVNATVGGSADQGVSYAITGGNAGNAFSIDATTGAIAVSDTRKFDHEGGPSSFTLTVEASEGSQTALQPITVTITDIDERPTFASDTSATVVESSTIGAVVIDVNATVGGNADQEVSYAITGGNTGSAFSIDANTGAITVADATQFSTTSQFTLTVSASEGTNTDTQDITVTVVDITDPTADAGSDQTVVEDVVTSFDGTHSTDNVGVESYEWDFGDGSLNSTAAEPDHTYTEPGVYTVTLSVTDDAGNADSDTLTVTVVDVTPPTADAGSDQAVDEDTPVSFTGGGSSDNGNIATYEWDFGDGSANATGATATHTFSNPGAYTVTLNVTDASGNTAFDTLTVTVNDTTPPPAPSTPHLETGSDSGRSDTDGLTNDPTPALTGTAEADAVVTISSDQDAVLGTTTADGTGNWSFTPPALSEGPHALTATATDAAGNTGPPSSGLTVSIDTVAPAAPATPDLSPANDSGQSTSDNVTNETTPTFSGTAEADTTVRLRFEKAGTLGTAAVDGAGSWTFTPSTDLTDGEYRLRVMANDDAGNKGPLSDRLHLTIDTSAPVAAAGANQTVDEDVPVSFDAAASTDGDGIASYEWTFGDGVSNASGQKPTYTYAEPGTYSVTLTVTDAAGNRATDTLTVSVDDTTNPTADAGSNQTVNEDTTVSFNGSNSTDNVGIVAYNWTFGDGTNATGATQNHTYSAPGRYTVTLNVSDAAGNHATDALNLTVQAVSSGGGGGGGGGGGSADSGQQIAVEPLPSADDGDETPPRSSRITIRNAQAHDRIAIDMSGAGTSPDTGDESESSGDDTDPDGSRPSEDERSSSSQADSNVLMDQIEMTVNRGGSYQLDVETREVTLPSITDDSDNQTGVSMVDLSTDALSEAGRQFVSETGKRPGGYIQIGHAFPDSDVSDVTFRFRVRKSYLSATGVDPGDVQLYRDEPSGWRALSTRQVGETDEYYQFTADSPGLSLFTVGTVAPVFEIADVSADPVDEPVHVGDAATVTVTVRNVGGVDGQFTGFLTANGDRLDRRAVAVPAGARRTIEVGGVLQQAGTIDLAVNGRTIESLEVLQPGVSEDGDGERGHEQAVIDPGATGDRSNWPMISLGIGLVIVLGVAILARRRWGF